MWPEGTNEISPPTMLPYGTWPSTMYASLPEKDKGNVGVGLRRSDSGGNFLVTGQSAPRDLLYNKVE